MNYNELLEKIKTGSELYSYPFKKKTDDDYYDFIFKIWKSYYEDLKKLDEESISFLNGCLSGTGVDLPQPLDVIEDSRKVYEMVSFCVHDALCGLPSEAFRKMEKFLLGNNLHYVNLLPMIEIPENSFFYRIRHSECTEQKKLFHIAFEERYKVKSMRYSIPGYPMLYLSSSLKTSYNEYFKDEEKHEFTYAKFQNKELLRFVDMGFPRINPEPFELYSFFTFFPLFMACSIDVEHEKEPFKTEYIVSQILTQFIKLHAEKKHPESKIDGISYLPPEMMRGASVDDIRSKNYALVVQGASLRRGYDTFLANKFLMTQPIRVSNNIIDGYIRAKDHGCTSCFFCFLETMHHAAPVLPIDLN